MSHFLQQQAEGNALPMPGLPDTLGTVSLDSLMTGITPFTAVQNLWLYDPLIIKVY